MLRKIILPVVLTFAPIACGTQNSSLQSNDDSEVSGRVETLKNPFKTLDFEVKGIGIDDFVGEDRSGDSCLLSYKNENGVARIDFYQEHEHLGYFLARKETLKGDIKDDGKGSYITRFFNDGGYSLEVTVIDDTYFAVAVKHGREEIEYCRQDL